MKRLTFLLIVALVLYAEALPAAATVTLPAGSLTVPSTGTFVYLYSETGDWVGSGREMLFENGPGITLGGAVRLDRSNAFVSSATENWQVNLSAPVGQALAVGSYTGATRYQTSTTPGLDVYGDGHGCNTTTGQFDINELAFSSLGEITVLDATFEQHCEGLAPALYGRVRIESPAPAPGSTLPPGNMTVPTSGTYLYLIRTNTNVGTYEQLYTAADSTFTSSLPQDTDTFNGKVVQGAYTHYWYVSLAAPHNMPLAVGTYDGAVRTMSRTGSQPGIDVSGDSGGCNVVSGFFTVEEVTFGWDGSLVTFQATFHYYCDNSLSLQHGRIRIENPPPPPPSYLGATINSVGTVNNQTGLATLSGTLSCSRSVQVSMHGTLWQQQSSSTWVFGEFQTAVDCVAPSVAWTYSVAPTSGKFNAGSTQAAVDVGCTYCYSASASQIVKLNGARE
ncbi:MAG TPA: hypothetical protein VI814_05160 [Candidatus Limnocylindria bacterium]